jgi:hypothetical protein
MCRLREKAISGMNQLCPANPSSLDDPLNREITVLGGRTTQTKRTVAETDEWLIGIGIRING